MTIDLRSDTVTKPTQSMLEAMVNAKVGDDVFLEDPTVLDLESRIATLFGFEAGLFVPSGTMSNQLCLHVLARPGEEVLIDELGHVYNYETGAAAHLSSLQLRPLRGHRGKLTPEIIRPAIRSRNDWDPWSTVIALENTTNKGGGACYTRHEVEAIAALAQSEGLALHMDGARIWNAITATGVEPAFFGTVADTMSVCFSKGLGAPVGSMMLASRERVRHARRIRKMWGGGMRQVGLLAAAAEHAVEHHWPLLAEDHRRARRFAEYLSGKTAVGINPEDVETNIVIFSVGGFAGAASQGESAVTSDGASKGASVVASGVAIDGASGVATDGASAVASVLQAYRDHDILMTPFGGDTIRAVFHFQVDDAMLEILLQATDAIFSARQAGV